MSSDSETPRRVITGADLARFHAAKGVDSKAIRCWVCGHGTWYIQSIADAPFHTLGTCVHADGLGSDAQAPKVLTLTCQNCGTLWNIDYETLTDWLEGNPA